MKSFGEAEWPIDLLHVSDVHFTDLPVIRAEREEAWARLVEDVAQRVADGAFRPRAIACTGDLVDDPWRPTFRRSVTALLQLARVCGFIDEEVRWEEGSAEAPEAWRRLLYLHIFLVPGNHDLYPTGLRFLWNPKATAEWLEVAGLPGWKPEKKARLEPQPSKVVGPLAVLMIDSNGSSAWWKSARGTVDHQIDLSWNPEDEVDDRHFRVAIVHAHPLQVPFFLDGVFDQEASLGMENAGFLLKNLADLGVQLILHGHRHYPCLYTLRLQDSHGQPKTIVIAGAGSATKAPGKWPYCSYNWIRVFPDRRVEVTILRREPHSPTFTRQLDAFSATAGDFVCDQIDREVEIHDDFGDVEITTRISGLRVLPGAPPVSRLPIERLARAAAACYKRLGTRTGGKRDLVWDEVAGLLELEPPLTTADGAAEIELRSYLHGAVACSEWESEQLGPNEGGWPFGFQTSFPARRLNLRFLLPTGADEKNLAASWVAPSQAGATTKAKPGASGVPRIHFEVEDPQPSGRLEVTWTPPGRDQPEFGQLRPILYLRQEFGHWQDRIRAEMESSTAARPLDPLCVLLAEVLKKQDVPVPDVAIYVPEVRKGALAGPPPEGAVCLHLAGARFRSAARPLTIPFGQGVEGRAYRSGSPVFFRRAEAELSFGRYRRDGEGRPGNFDFTSTDAQSVAVFSAPIYPVQVAAGLSSRLGVEIDAHRPDLTMVVASFSWSKPAAFMALADPQLAALFVSPLEEIESWISELVVRASSGADDGG